MQLFEQLLGAPGVKALEPLLKTELATFIAPRAIVSWLTNSPYGELQLGDIKLVKNGYGLDGKVTIGAQEYTFEHAPEETVAAAISVSLGYNEVSSNIKALDLAKLSKTIDLLVKTVPRYLTKEPVAPAAPKQEPLEAIPQQPKQAVTNKVIRRGVAKTVLVSEKESKTKCKLCGKAQFDKNEFTGCTCLKPLAKSIKAESKGTGYLLTFNNVDEMMTLVEAIGRIHG